MDLKLKLIKSIPSALQRGSIDTDLLARALKKVDPKTRHVVIFPDSRNVFPGMGLNLMQCKSSELVYEQASDIVKTNILKLCTQSDKIELRSNLRNQYLAAFVTSHATMAKFGFEKPHDHELCKGAGGIGIGLLNSLVFSGSMTFKDALDLLERYSQTMEKAATIVPNSRLHVYLKPGTNRVKVCQAAVEHCLLVGIPKEVAVCSIAASPRSDLLVYAGHEEAIRYLEDEGYRLFDFREMRRDEVIPYAYHTNLMRPARDFIEGYINDKLKQSADYIKEPQTSSVYSSICGRRVRNVKSIISDLINFPTSAIRIQELLGQMYMRPKEVPQPNTVVPWDKYYLRIIAKTNRKAGDKTRLLEA